MKEKLKPIIDEKIKHLDLFVDDILWEKEENDNFLRIVLDTYDSERIIDLDQVVMATRIINPLLDKEDLFTDEYMLDVYAKSKGDVINE